MEKRMDAIHRIRKFNRLYTKVLGLLDRHILNSGYSLTEARVLFELKEIGCGAASGLSEELSIDKSYLSRILHKFEKCGLISREASVDDGRSSRIELTERGISVIRDLIEKSDSQIRHLLAPLSDAECGDITAAMTLLEKSFTFATQVTIRPFARSDIDFVIESHLDLYRTEYNLTSEIWKAYVIDGVRHFADWFDAEKDCAYILEYGGAPSGCIAVAHAEGDVAQLRFFFVDPAARGLGIGHKLIDMALVFCREKNYRHVFLWTFSKLGAARHLYKRHGFVMTDTRQNREWGEPIVEERWDLDL